MIGFHIQGGECLLRRIRWNFKYNLRQSWYSRC